MLSPKRIRATTGGIAPHPHQPPKPSLFLENRHCHRLLKSIQTKLKTAPVTLRERFCIILILSVCNNVYELAGNNYLLADRLALKRLCNSFLCHLQQFVLVGGCRHVYTSLYLTAQLNYYLNGAVNAERLVVCYPLRFVQYAVAERIVHFFGDVGSKGI